MIIMSRKMKNTDAYFSSAKEEKVRSSSFSSNLLEAVYRSIDKEGQQPDEMSMFGAERNKKKQTSARDSCSKREEIEKWMEKRTVSSGFHDVNPRRKLPEAKVLSNNNVLLSSEMARNHGLVSSSHCSDSSSTVERDYLSTTAVSKIPKSKSTNSGYQLSNPTREATSSSNKVLRHSGGAASTSSSRQFHKTKAHALKFYKELKKMKQPISPGGRLATLINSLFLTGHPKKAKFANDHDHEAGGADDHHQPNENTCSSASSFSRSCLSHKSSSSSASSINKATRSVRFSSTLLNEQKPVKMDVGDCSDAETTGDIQALLRKYHNADLFAIYSEFEEAEDDDEDGVSSCGSSDLFELDHLMGRPVGMEELPVYETTLLSANRPIANSLLA